MCDGAAGADTSDQQLLAANRQPGITVGHGGQSGIYLVEWRPQGLCSRLPPGMMTFCEGIGWLCRQGCGGATTRE